MSDSEPSTIGANPISYASITEPNGGYAQRREPAHYGDKTPDTSATDNNGAVDTAKEAVDVAKDQAASVGQGAVAAGQQAASTAKDQAQNVAAEAATQARDLLGQARTELTDQASTQQKRLAEGLRVLGDELHSMAANSEHAGLATDLAHQGADKAHDVASWLDGREPGNLVQELRGFARQRPLAFLALAAGAGVLAGRLTRGLQAASGADDDTGAAGHSDTTVTRAPVDSSVFDSSTTVPGALLVDEASVDTVRPFASSQDAASVDRRVGDRL